VASEEKGGKMSQNEFIEVTDQQGDKLKIEISWESDVWKWVRIFKAILRWLEFPESTVEKALGKEE